MMLEKFLVKEGEVMDFNEVLPEVDMVERYQNDPLLAKIVDTYWQQWKKSDSDEKISRMEFLERYQDRIMMAAYSYLSIEIDRMAHEQAERTRREELKKMQNDSKLIGLDGQKLGG